MSIEQKTNAPTDVAAAEAERVSAIENEIPAYRAINPQSIVALVLGVLAVFSFASWYFLSLAVAAAVVGFLADRKIQRFPDVLTGRGLAQAGIGLGLTFGLTALTINTVQGVIRTSQAKAFAQSYIETARKGSEAQLVWLGQPPESRARSTPDEVVAAVLKEPGGAMMYDQKYGSVRELKKRLAVPGAEIHYQGVESQGEDGLDPYAAVVLDVHAPQAGKGDVKEERTLAYMRGTRGKGGRYEWWVESLTFPYKPTGTPFQPPTKAVDDGHGHAH